MLYNYFKIALRRLLADKLHAGINILGLALSMSCCLVIYLFVRYETTFDAIHTYSNRTYRVVEQHQKADGMQHWATTAYPLAAAIRRDIPGATVAQTAGPVSRIISAADKFGTVCRFEEKRLMFADENYLQIFDFGKYFKTGIWLAGNAATAFQSPNAIVLTEQMAERYFAGCEGHYEQLLSKNLTLNNTDLLVVSGVIRNPPANTNLPFDLLVNYQFFKANNAYPANNWSGNYQGTTYVTLAEGTSPQTFETQLAILKQKYMNKEDNRQISYFLQPITDIHTETLYDDSQSGYHVSREILWGLTSLAVFLILIASFNFINLTTAKAIRRRKEVGIRKVVGGTQAQLFGQFFGETLLIAAVAGLISIGTLEVWLAWLNHSLTIIQLDLRPNAGVWAFGAGLIGIVALCAGFYPSVVLSRSKPVTALKNTFVKQSNRVTLRQGLITLQFFITYILVVGTLVASQQMRFFQQKPLGFASEALITVNGPRNQVPGKLDAFRQQLLQNPAIREVSFSSGAPITQNHFGTNFRLKSEDLTMGRQAEMKVVDLAYTSLFGLQLIAGNWFSPANQVADGAAFNGFIANETMVKALGLVPETAIGKTVAINEGEAPILGVVKDFHNASLQQSITPCILMCWNTGFYEQIHIGLQLGGNHGGNTRETLQAIEQTWKQIFPQDVYQYVFLDEALAKAYTIEQLVFNAFRGFAAISILISCLGLFGLITFMGEQRRKEIGVRKVLGASVVGITGLLAKDFLKLVLIAIVIASPVAYFFMDKWLSDFAYRIDIQWWMFVAAGAAAVAIAFLTVGFQSVKAALANPVKSLRSE